MNASRSGPYRFWASMSSTPEKCVRRATPTVDSMAAASSYSENASAASWAHFWSTLGSAIA